MKISTLLTHNKLELPCVILPVKKQLFPIGKEVLVYCQNRLIRGYIEDDDDFVAELEVVVEFIVAPELAELIEDSKTTNITEIYYVQSSHFRF